LEFVVQLLQCVFDFLVLLLVAGTEILVVVVLLFLGERLQEDRVEKIDILLAILKLTHALIKTIQIRSPYSG
jgi:hypothetical protein